MTSLKTHITQRTCHPNAAPFLSIMREKTLSRNNQVRTIRIRGKDCFFSIWLDSEQMQATKTCANENKKKRESKKAKLARSSTARNLEANITCFPDPGLENAHPRQNEQGKQAVYSACRYVSEVLKTGKGNLLPCVGTLCCGGLINTV